MLNKIAVIAPPYVPVQYITANSITPWAGSRLAVKGNKIAASVSMLTPGIAPNSIPPRTPKIKIKTEIGSLKRAVVPIINFSTIFYFTNFSYSATAYLRKVYLR